MTHPSRREHWRLYTLGAALALVLVLVAVAAMVALFLYPAGPGDEPETAQPVPDSTPVDRPLGVPPATPAPTESTSSTTAPIVPAVPAFFEPAENEIQPEAKRLGTRVAQLLTNYEVGATPAELARSVTPDPAAQAVLAEAAAPLLHPTSWSRGQVEYAQLGGLTNTKVSIMVVLRQEIGDVDGNRRVETRTLDVRLRRDDGVWVFDELASAGGRPIPRPAGLSDAAIAVVDNPDIRLPDSAIWDIYSGHTDERLLSTMNEIAEWRPFAAVVLHTGHPFNVFETDRVSNHSVGRAIDIYQVGDERVVDGRDEGTVTYQFTERLAGRPDIFELGSPWTFPGAVAHTFTNEVHQDHIHLAVRG